MKKVNKESIFIHILVIFCIVFISLYHIKDFDFLAVLNDEFGYWANAASVVGYDWGDLIQETPYYAWGYSIFLIPLLWFFRDYYIVYKMAIILNVVFLIVSFECALYVSRKIVRGKKIEPIFWSFLAIIYPANIIYAQVAWSESLLCMLMWISVALLFSLEDNFSYITFIGYIVILGYMYIVHQRSIGVVIIGIITAGLVLQKNKKPFWVWLVPLAILIGCYFLNSVIKNVQINMLWRESALSNMNNVGLDKNTFSTYIYAIINNLKDLIKSMGGKFFELLIATGLTAPVVILISGYEIVNYKTKRDKRNFIPFFYIISSMIAMWGICSLQMMGDGIRKDIIVYSRYMDNVVGPFLLFAIICILKRHKMVRYGLFLALALVMVGIGYIYETILNAEGGFNVICSPIIGAFLKSSETIEEMMAKIGISAIIIFLNIFIFYGIKNLKYRNVGIYFVFISFYIVTIHYGSKYVLDWRQEVDNNITVIRDYIVENYNNSEIYYVKDAENDLYSVNPKYLQFMIPYKEIKIINSNELGEIDEESIVILNPYTENISEKMVLKMETDMLKVMHIEQGGS